MSGHLPFSVAIMVVGALIFVLGIDLVKEAVWDTRGRVSPYVTVLMLTPLSAHYTVDLSI